MRFGRSCRSWRLFCPAMPSCPLMTSQPAAVSTPSWHRGWPLGINQHPRDQWKWHSDALRMLRSLSPNAGIVWMYLTFTVIQTFTTITTKLFRCAISATFWDSRGSHGHQTHWVHSLYALPSMHYPLRLSSWLLNIFECLCERSPSASKSKLLVNSVPCHTWRPMPPLHHQFASTQSPTRKATFNKAAYRMMQDGGRTRVSNRPYEIAGTRWMYEFNLCSTWATIGPCNIVRARLLVLHTNNRSSSSQKLFFHPRLNSLALFQVFSSRPHCYLLWRCTRSFWC